VRGAAAIEGSPVSADTSVALAAATSAAAIAALRREMVETRTPLQVLPVPLHAAWQPVPQWAEVTPHQLLEEQPTAKREQQGG
jgi:hypothetical protein